MSLDPEDFVVRTRAAWFYGQSYRDWRRAHEELARLVAQQPNSTDAAYLLARAATRLGQPEEALAQLRRAWQLEPVFTSRAEWLARTYRGLRRYDAAREVYAQLEGASQLNPFAAFDRVLIDFRTSRDAAGVAKFVERLPPAASRSRFMLRRLRDAAWELGDVPTFLQRAQAVQPGDGDDLQLQQTFLAMALRQSGDVHASQEQFERTQTDLRQRLSREPDNATAWAILGLNLAASEGSRTEALAAARRAIALVPLASDAVDAPHMRAAHAATLAWLGERAEAVAELGRLLANYYEETWGFYIPIYVGHLRRGITWQPLRGFPPFEALLDNPTNSAPL